MYRERTIQKNESLLSGLKKMDILDKKLLIVLDNHKFLGLLSVGDIQRAIIQNKPLDTIISDILRPNIKIASPEDQFKDIKKMMLEFRMELCPVVDKKNQITKIFFWEDLFEDKKPNPKKEFDLPVVIMAGGKGTRMRPITNVIPKPLVPVGETTIIEHIFKYFAKNGSERFYISVNYKAKLIEYYLNERKLPFKLSYFKENKPMGTAGSLSLLKNKINETFFMTNCDILVDQDYSEIVDYHKKNNNEITIVAALKHYNIPYGTIKTGKYGMLKELNEKPELTFKINSGMYILEPHLLNEIQEDTFFNITDLIEKIQNRKGKIGVFPVSEKSWKDIGQWEEYLKHNSVQ